VSLPEGFYLPPSMTRDVRVYDCRICGEEHDEQGMARCAQDHIEEARGQRLKERLPIFDPENWSPEAEAHLREVGKRMIDEGRLEMKKSERVFNE
jgi:hypothetical protein